MSGYNEFVDESVADALVAANIKKQKDQRDATTPTRRRSVARPRNISRHNRAVSRPVHKRPH